MTAQIPVAHQLEKAVVAVPQISRESCSLNEALSCCQLSIRKSLASMASSRSVGSFG